MALVISVHEYELKPDVHEAAFENAIRDAERRGLLNLRVSLRTTSCEALKGIGAGPMPHYGSLKAPRRGRVSGGLRIARSLLRNIQRAGKSGNGRSSHPS